MTTRHDSSTRRFARRIFIAAGLSPAAAAALLACGSDVVVQSGAGGSEGASVVSSASSSSSGGFECNEPLPRHSEMVLDCIDSMNGSCPAPEAVVQHFEQSYGGVCDDPDSCWCYGTDPNFCSCFSHVDSIPCGPSEQGQQCCYYAIITVEEFCEGRPFEVAGHARLAPTRSRSDWLCPATPQLDGLSSQERQHLADAWTQDALYEHASVASFARFVLELLAAGAPAAMVTGAQRALTDEIRHAKLCFGLASGYAAEPRGPGALRIEGSLTQRQDLASIAAATVREGCVNETIAALCAHEAYTLATDPAVRDVLAQIVHDEMAHAELAWRFVTWAAQQDTRARDAVVNELAAALARPHDHPSLDTTPAAQARQLNAHGQLTPQQQQQIMKTALLHVVAPAATALLHSEAEPQSHHQAPPVNQPALAPGRAT